ncbi:MAG: UDP-N-acetylmuramate--L-alanine ligase, partial [Bacteroidales bacterium]|nr:UDP-N-acetylmuramate--L-alanine ligase [Bacteroidales bacterium]
ALFQPHLYTRTRDFYKDFAEALSLLDEVILTDIYPARELPIEGVTSHELFIRMNRMNVNKGSVILKNTIVQIARKTDAEIIVTIGAGNIDRSCNEIVEMLKEKHNE